MEFTSYEHNKVRSNFAPGEHLRERNNVLKSFRKYVPFAQLHPLRTFPLRSFNKTVALLIFRFLREWRLVGCKLVSLDDSGLATVRLNRNYPLGLKGSHISLPKDLVIFESVIRRGRWESEESDFFVSQIQCTKSQGRKMCLLDIGANTGLFSLQVANKISQPISYYLIEPLPINLKCLALNVSELKQKSDVEVFPFGLGDSDQIAKMYTETTNVGNSSMILSAMESGKYTESSIAIRDTRWFVLNHLSKFDAFFLKSDIQGMDAEVLSMIPNQIWEKTSCASIEIYSNRDIRHEDIDKCAAYWKNFSSFSWADNPTKIVLLEDVISFWKSGRNEQRNLRISRQAL